MKPEHLNLTLIKLEDSLNEYIKRYNITSTFDVIFLGSQSILFHHKNIKSEKIIQSYEMDIIVSFDSELKKNLRPQLKIILDHIDYAYGYGSNLHNCEDFYIDNMTEIDDEQQKKWPRLWLERAKIIEIKNSNIRFICLDKHDVTILKLIANREKDLEYVQTLIQGGLLKKKTLLKIIKECTDIINDKQKQDINKKIKHFYSLNQLNILVK